MNKKTKKSYEENILPSLAKRDVMWYHATQMSHKSNRSQVFWRIIVMVISENTLQKACGGELF